MQSGETVFIPDAANDPSLRHVKDELINRRVKSITVVPITWRSVAIGAIFLRTYRDGPTFSDADVRFVQVVAALTAQSLRNAHRYERLAHRTHETGDQLRRMELERVALRSEEHTSELQSLAYLVCRLLLEKKKKIQEYNKQLIAHARQ